MAQESWKVEVDKDETGCQPPEGPILCSNNCGFYGSPTTMNLCSQCYAFVVKQTKAASDAATSISITVTGPQPRPVELQVIGIEAGTSSQANETEASKDKPPSEKQPAKSNRCFMCSKRVGLTGFKCRCGNIFCSLHRYNDKHDCSFDYKTAARDAIAKANPVVKADKIDKI